MKLYYLPGACSLASDIALREAGIPFELVRVDPSKRTADGQDLTQLNPKGYVPTLALDDGQVLTENVAVLAYIGGLNPGKKLAPAPGTPGFYHLLEWLGFINSEVHKNLSSLFASQAQDVQQLARGNLAKRLPWLDGVLAGRSFLMGEEVTVADAYLFTVLRWTSHLAVDLGPWPAVKAFVERMSARPAVLEALKAEGLIKG